MDALKLFIVLFFGYETFLERAHKLCVVHFGEIIVK